MNETKLSKRQKAILDILGITPLSREQISKELYLLYPVSKTTLYRDLQELETLGQIAVQGIGKSTRYASLENPLTRSIDIHAYFQDESNERLTARDSFNVEIFKYLPDIINKQEIVTAEIVLKKLSIQEEKMDPTLFKREIERFTVEFSWKSSHIEGNTYTLLETELLLKQKREATGHPKYEAIMLINHKDAVDYILNNRNDFQTLTMKNLQMIHGLLVKDLDISPGIRQGEVAITGTNYIPPHNEHDILKALENTIATIQQVTSPLARSLIAHAMIAYIQPFNDGNKRTARTIANALLIASDMYPLSYRTLDELDYLHAILLFYEQNNLYHLKRIFFDQLQFSASTYFKTS